MLSIGLKLQHHCLDGLLPLPVASSRMPQARAKQSSSFVWSRIAAPPLSKDGQTLTDAFRANQQDGSTLSLDYVYKRTTPGSGFVATWESTSEQMNSVVEFQIEPYQGDGLTFLTPAAHQTLNLRFDGKDYPNVGPDVPANSAYSARRLNERTLEITDKIKGKVTDTQQIELSPDFKTLTQTVHPADQGTPNILVFERE